MTITARQAAKAICQNGNWTVTNMKLHKALYLAHMFYMGKYGTPLISDEFEAWRYGPVVRSLYNDMRMFGAREIKNVFWDTSDLDSDSPEAEYIAEACDALLPRSTANLVEITHNKDGAWKKAYDLGRNEVITDEEILAEYKEFYA